MWKWAIITFFAMIVVIILISHSNKSRYEYFQRIQSVESSVKKENSYKVTEVNTTARKKKLLRMIDLSNVPVELYGIVVDENEKPISGAVVSWRVGQGGYSFASG